MRTLYTILILALAAVLALAQPPAKGGPKANPPEWHLTTNPKITLSYADGRIAGNAGCNRYNGGVMKGGGDAITVSPIASTMMACADESVSRAEFEFLQRLQAAKTLKQDAARITITYDLGAGKQRGTLEFVPEAAK